MFPFDKTQKDGNLVSLQYNFFLNRLFVHISATSVISCSSTIYPIYKSLCRYNRIENPYVTLRRIANPSEHSWRGFCLGLFCIFGRAQDPPLRLRGKNNNSVISWRLVAFLFIFRLLRLFRVRQHYSALRAKIGIGSEINKNFVFILLFARLALSLQHL